MKRTMHALAIRALSLLCLALAPAAQAAFPDSDLFVPSVGRGEGAEGSQWYTSLWLYNPGTATADVTISLLRRDQANPSPEQQHVTLPAASTVVFPDALIELFGLDSVTGALWISSSRPVVAGARIFNQPGDTVRESQGQLMAGLPGRLAIARGESTDVPGVVQPADESFRSNFGLVETAGATAEVLVTLYDGDGVELANRRFSLGPYAALQRSLAALGGVTTVAIGRLQVRVVGGDGAVLAFASAVANGVDSQDPTTLEMDFAADAFGTADGVVEVIAGPGLMGGGVGGEVTLQVKPGDGIAVSPDGVAIRPSGVRAEHVAPGQLQLGTKVGGTVLRDVVTLAAGDGVSLDTSGNTITIAASGAASSPVYLEQALTAATATQDAGSWVIGSDRLRLPTAGRWRVGYRALAQVQNFGVGTASDPVTIALIQMTGGQSLIRGSLSVLGLQLGISMTNSAFVTVSGESVIEVDRASDLAIAGRSSSSAIRLTLHPHDVNLSNGLAAPDGASFLYAEKLPS